MNILISSAGRRVGLINCFRQSLQELGLRGRIIAIDVTPYSSAAQSADEFFLVPKCTDADFIPEVRAICERSAVRLIVPTIDTELPIYAASRHLFEEQGVTVAISAPNTIAICYDKILTSDWLSGSGFPSPHQASPSAVLSDRSQWSLPVIVKPVFGSGSTGVRKVSSFEELETLSRSAEASIVQECVTGVEHTVNVFINRQGSCLCAVPHARIETRAGEVSKGVTVKDERLMHLATEVAQALPGAYGPLNVQAFVTFSGDIKIIEINARFGGGYPLTHQAGAPISQWLIEEVIGREPRMPFDRWQSGLVMLRYDHAVFVSQEALDSSVRRSWASSSVLVSA